MEEPIDLMNNDVDVNVLIGLYNQKMATIMNQNVLLEAKYQSLKKDFETEKTKLLTLNLDLQKQVDELTTKTKSKSKTYSKPEDKYQEGIED
tara:strand:+ start:411 stop:686 length:276 start_codon:yes stop_codon:yes gene_type:complete